MEQLKKGYKKTEVGVIPEDWDVKLLSEVVDFLDGKRKPIKSSERNSGEFPYYGASGIIDYVNDYIFDDELILLGEDGENILSRNLPLAFKVKGKIWVNNHAHVLKPKVGNDITYLTDYLESLDYSLLNSGTAQPKLNKQACLNIKIACPSLTEQKAIADALTDVSELITNLEKLIAKKKAIKQGAMQQLLTPKEHWKSKTIKELATYRRGSFPQPYGLSKWYDDISGTPFVQVVDVDNNKKLKKETKARISKEGQKYSVFVPKGSIILTIQGSIGRICITDYDAYVDRTLLIFESLIEDFNKYFFMMSIFLKFEIEKEKAPGGIIKTITKEALSSFVISYPEIEEQNYISEILQNMDNEIELLEKKLEKKRIIKQGMMQELLTGKTRLI
jgi:type I restriction enzyme S subunit